MAVWQYLFSRIGFLKPSASTVSNTDNFQPQNPIYTWWQRRQRQRTTLRQAFFRSNVQVALVSVLLAALVMSLLGMFGLQAYAKYTMQRVGRSLGFAVEAAVITHDRATLQQTLHAIVSEEKIAQAHIYDANGQELARYYRPGKHFAAQWLLGGDYIQPLQRADQRIGSIHLRRHADVLPRFLLATAASTGFILLLAAWVALCLSRRMARHVLEPVEEMAHVTHAIRHQRDFARRVPSARLIELNELSEDFNALLEELHAWQTRLEQENAQLAHQASHDSLTGLPNRAFFQGRLNRVLCDAQRQGHHVALMFVDCDHFKQINDQFGHAAGDEVLRTIATRLRSQLRQTDLVARLGGDEFAVLITPAPHTENVLRIARDIQAGMALPIQLKDGRSLQSSLSIGIALYPEHGDNPVALLEKADLTMYHVKRGQRGQCQMAE